MHIYDPNGQLREYQRQRQRNENYHSLLFGIGCVCFLGAAICAAFITLSLIGK